MAPFIFLTVIISLVSMASAAQPGLDLISETCTHTIYPDTCVSTFQADPNGLTADLEGLAVISIKAAHDIAVQTSTYIAEMSKKSPEPMKQQAMNDCSENYLDAVDQLGDSVAAILDKKYNDVNAWVTAAMSDVDSCEQTSSDNTGQLSQKNFELSKLCSNALSITRLLTG